MEEPMNTEELIQQKNDEYRAYIDEHRANIVKATNNMSNNKACCELIRSRLSDPANLDLYFNNIKETHDLSKYEYYEFDAYRKKYYPISEQEKKEVEDSGEYDRAEMHHYLSNPHHWNYWVLNNSVNQMSILAVVEMVIDWISMSIKFNSKATDWYNKNKSEIVLGDWQREFVEKLLNVYYK